MHRTHRTSARNLATLGMAGLVALALALPVVDALAAKKRRKRPAEKSSVSRTVAPAAAAAAAEEAAPDLRGATYEPPTTFVEPAVSPDLAAPMPGVTSQTAEGATVEVTLPVPPAVAVAAPAAGKSTTAGQALAESSAKEPAAAAASKEPVANSSGTMRIPTGDAKVEAEFASCEKLLAGRSLEFTYVAPIRNGACGTLQPVSVSGVGTPRVKISPPAIMNCRLLAGLDTWLTQHVQPLAKQHLQAPIARTENAASYDCRTRYGAPGEKLSEHAFANALDVSGFITTSGLRVSVVTDWGPNLRDLTAVARAAAEAKQKAAESKAMLAKADAEAAGEGAKIEKRKEIRAEIERGEHKRGTARNRALLAEAADLGVAAPKPATSRARFLHEAHAGACKVFGTILGPEANAAHRDHFHLDMTPRRTSYCQ